MFNLKNKVAGVTGASRGIGKSIVKTLAEAGAHVVCASRSKVDLESLSTSLNDKGLSTTVFPCDVSDLESFKTNFDQLKPTQNLELGQSLLENIKHEEKFVQLMQKAAERGSIRLMDRTRSADCDFGIMMLFSFSSFATFHKCICNYVNNNGTITEEFTNDYNKLLILLQSL